MSKPRQKRLPTVPTAPREIPVKDALWTYIRGPIDDSFMVMLRERSWGESHDTPYAIELALTRNVYPGWARTHPARNRGERRDRDGLFRNRPDLYYINDQIGRTLCLTWQEDVAWKLRATTWSESHMRPSTLPMRTERLVWQRHYAIEDEIETMRARSWDEPHIDPATSKRPKAIVWTAPGNLATAGAVTLVMNCT